MKLKFAPFCSSQDALSNGILFFFNQSQNFQILAENHGLQSDILIGHSLWSFYSKMEGGIILYEAEICAILLHKICFCMVHLGTHTHTHTHTHTYAS